MVKIIKGRNFDIYDLLVIIFAIFVATIIIFVAVPTIKAETFQHDNASIDNNARIKDIKDMGRMWKLMYKNPPKMKDNFSQ
jgi:uncharacterized membrane protein